MTSAIPIHTASTKQLFLKDKGIYSYELLDVPALLVFAKPDSNSDFIVVKMSCGAYPFGTSEHEFGTSERVLYGRISSSPIDDRDVELSDFAKKVLGVYEVSRFEEFKQYPEGWDFGIGKSLSSESVKCMELFLRKYADFSEEPALFFTRNGNLQLGWSDETGQDIELEFFPDRIEYYIESISEEGSIHLDNIEELIKKL
jgi:hypothetical protein